MGTPNLEAQFPGPCMRKTELLGQGQTVYFVTAVGFSGVSTRNFTSDSICSPLTATPTADSAHVVQGMNRQLNYYPGLELLYLDFEERLVNCQFSYP